MKLYVFVYNIKSIVKKKDEVYLPETLKIKMLIGKNVRPNNTYFYYVHKL
jgi:hypothetical protein